ncbi:MAG: dihydrolipoamide acetyltransferase, partial [Aquabacterium sp.]
MPLIELKVPDIGDISDVSVIELLVKPGDAIKAEQSLVTVESDKASMEIPATSAGVLKELLVKVGDKVSEGTVIARLEAAEGAAKPAAPAPVAAPAPAPAAPAASPGPIAAAPAPAAEAAAPTEPTAAGSLPHASPSVRQFARELGVPLAQVGGSGPKGRITHEDVQRYVKGVIGGQDAPAAAPAGGGVGGLSLLPWPK